MAAIETASFTGSCFLLYHKYADLHHSETQMDEKSYMELVIDLAAFTPDQSWKEILKQLVSTMVTCTDKLNSGDIGRLLAVAAAIYRKGKREDG